MFTRFFNQLRRGTAALTSGAAALGLAAVLALGAVASNDAEAKRVGGGQSVGRQSQAASPSGQGQSGQQAQTARQAAQPPAAPGSRWMGPLAGLAAGFGIAALLSSFGLADELAQMLSNTLLIGLVVVAGVLLFRFIARRRRPDLAYGQGVANRQQTNGSAFSNQIGHARPATNVRNWPHAAMDSANATKTVNPLLKPDQAVFLEFAKSMFMRLQGAWDRNEQGDLFELTTPEMFARIKEDLEARGSQPSLTEVTQIDAEIWHEESNADEILVSVRFHGQMREDHAPTAQSFQEVWNLVRSVHGDQAWRLAGIQQIDR